jgi:hypothetical protein
VFGHGWKTGSAKVLRRELLSSKDGYKSFEYLLEVSPDGGLESFQTTLKDPRVIWHQPQPNEVVRVHCNPEKREAKWDRSDSKARTEARKGGSIGPGGAPDWF